MRVLCCLAVLILCLPACSRSESVPAPVAAEPEFHNALRVRVLDAGGEPIPGVRLEPSWGEGSVSSRQQATRLPVGQGELVFRLEGGEIVVLPWKLPARDADVEITLYPVTAKAGKPLEFALPVQMGTGYIWHPLRPDSGCTQETFEKRRGDAPNLVGGSGTQQFLGPGKKAGDHAEGFALARFAGAAEKSYPTTENGRMLFRVAVMLIAIP